MMSMRKEGVLITDGNERSALAATRALGRRGIPVYVGAESPTSLAGRSRYCARTFQYPSPWRRPQEYTACVLEFAKRLNVAVLLPMTDVAVEVIGEQGHELKGIVSVPIPTLAQYRRLSNKYELTEWATRNGIPVPQSLFVRDGGIEGVLDQITEWPVIVKPGASLVWKDGLWAKTSVHVANNADELIHLYEDRWYLKLPSMVQQRIVGDGQGIFGLFSHGLPLALFAHKRIREKPPGGGVSVLRESIPLARPVTDYALRILESAQWHGVAMVEFKVDRKSGVPYLMEVNGRFWGSLQLAIDAGVDFPFLAYELARGGRLDSVEQRYSIGVKSRWFLGDLDQLLLRLRKTDAQLGMPPGSPTKRLALREFLDFTDSRTHSEVFRLSDPRPGFYELRTYLQQLARTLVDAVSSRIPQFETLSAKSRWALIGVLGLRDAWLRKRVPRPVNKLLILCKGNVCRSPFAAELMRERIRQLGLNICVTSAGLEVEPNRDAHPLARRMARLYGVSLSAHRATPLARGMASEADLILVMEFGQARDMRKHHPASARKVFLLGQFGSEPDCEIPDPYGAASDAFARCYDRIKKDCDHLLSHLVRMR